MGGIRVAVIVVGHIIQFNYGEIVVPCNANNPDRGIYMLISCVAA